MAGCARSEGFCPPETFGWRSPPCVTTTPRHGRGWMSCRFRFSDGGELSGHALGNLLLSGLWEKTSDPVAGLDELVRLLGCSGRVLPCCVDPTGDCGGHSRSRRAASGGGQRGSWASGGRDGLGGAVLRVWVEPPQAKACPQAVAAIEAADVITLGPGSWFTSVMPHLVVPEIGDAVADSSATRVLVLNLVEQEGETGGFTPEEHLEALKRHAPQVTFDHVIADSTHIRGGPGRDNLVSACASWGSEVTFADVSATADRHDPGKLGACFRYGSLSMTGGSATMAMTAAVKDELSRVEVTKTCCRKAEVSSLLRFGGALHIVSGAIVVEVEVDAGRNGSTPPQGHLRYLRSRQRSVDGSGQRHSQGNSICSPGIAGW